MAKAKNIKEKTENIKGKFRFRSVCLDLKDSFTLSEREFFSLILVTAQCEHEIGLPMKPSGSDGAFAFAPIQTNPNRQLV